ncbi:MAG: hypothetical protein WDN46_24530 [Methylocella sp.]
MTTFNDRLAEFGRDELPADGAPVEILCVDHVGTYVIPFPCCRLEGAWCNSATGAVIEARVVGWRSKA